MFFLHCSCILSQVKPVLDKLNGDNDVDVKYFASEAIAGIAGNRIIVNCAHIYHWYSVARYSVLFNKFTFVKRTVTRTLEFDLITSSLNLLFPHQISLTLMCMLSHHLCLSSVWYFPMIFPAKFEKYIYITNIQLLDFVKCFKNTVLNCLNF